MMAAIFLLKNLLFLRFGLGCFHVLELAIPQKRRRYLSTCLANKRTHMFPLSRHSNSNGALDGGEKNTYWAILKVSIMRGSVRAVSSCPFSHKNAPGKGRPEKRITDTVVAVAVEAIVVTGDDVRMREKQWSSINFIIPRREIIISIPCPTSLNLFALVGDELSWTVCAVPWPPSLPRLNGVEEDLAAAATNTKWIRFIVLCVASPFFYTISAS